MSKEELAGMLYDSLNNKIKTLPDDVIVYPAHGPGSACGKNLGKETFSTIGVQKEMNYALKEMTKAEFVKAIIDGLSAPPQYFPKNAQINKSGYLSLNEVLKRNEKALTVTEFENAVKEGAIVLDSRTPDVFGTGFVKGAVNIGLQGRFAEWVGTLFDINQPFVLVTDEGKEHETILRMARVGYENVKGYLAGGINSWKEAGKEIDMIISIDAEEMQLDLKHEEITVMDVRKETEYNTGHVEGALNVVLQSFDKQLPEDLTKEEPIYIHCQGGYRSMIAASLLRRKGFNNLKNIYKGYDAISKTDIPVEVTQEITT